MGRESRTLTTANAAVDVDQLELSLIAGKNVKWYNPLQSVSGLSKN